MTDDYTLDPDAGGDGSPPPGSLTRRSFVAKAGVVGATTWAAPMILSSTAGATCTDTEIAPYDPAVTGAPATNPVTTSESGLLSARSLTPACTGSCGGATTIGSNNCMAAFIGANPGTMANPGNVLQPVTTPTAGTTTYGSSWEEVLNKSGASGDNNAATFCTWSIYSVHVDTNGNYGWCGDTGRVGIHAGFDDVNTCLGTGCCRFHHWKLNAQSPQFHDVHANGRVWVVAGSGTAIMTSPDYGITWYEYNLPDGITAGTNDAGIIHAIHWDPTSLRWIIAGSSSNSARSGVWTSAAICPREPSDWVPVMRGAGAGQINNAAAVIHHDIAVCGSNCYVVGAPTGTQASVWWSNNAGASWTNIGSTNTSAPFLNAMVVHGIACSAGGTLLACGDAGRIIEWSPGVGGSGSTATGWNVCYNDGSTVWHDIDWTGTGGEFVTVGQPNPGLLPTGHTGIIYTNSSGEIWWSASTNMITEGHKLSCGRGNTPPSSSTGGCTASCSGCNDPNQICKVIAVGGQAAGVTGARLRNIVQYYAPSGTTDPRWDLLDGLSQTSTVPPERNWSGTPQSLSMMDIACKPDGSFAYLALNGDVVNPTSVVVYDTAVSAWRHRKLAIDQPRKIAINPTTNCIGIIGGLSQDQVNFIGGAGGLGVSTAANPNNRSSFSLTGLSNARDISYANGVWIVVGGTSVGATKIFRSTVACPSSAADFTSISVGATGITDPLSLWGTGGASFTSFGNGAALEFTAVHYSTANLWYAAANSPRNCVFLSEDNGVSWKLWSDKAGSGTDTIYAIASNPCEYAKAEPGGAAFAIEPGTADGDSAFAAASYPTTILASSGGLWTNPKGQRATRPSGSVANGAVAAGAVQNQQALEGIYWLEEGSGDGTDFSGATGTGSPGAGAEFDCVAVQMKDVVFEATTKTFYAVGSTGKIMASCSDGRGWHGHNMPTSQGTMEAVIACTNLPCTYTRTVLQTNGVSS